MITFSFDEQGEFEKVNKTGLFIGGFMYDDFGYEDETEKEKKRIISFFEKACEEAGTIFPINLHPMAQNDLYAGRTKEVYSRHFMEFIKSGTYNEELLCEERKGKYTFIFELEMPGGRGKYENEKGIWVTDENGVNKYNNMVSDYVCNALFYNDILGINGIKMDFPTRMADASFEEESFIKLGRKKDPAKKDKTLYFDTNASFYEAKINEFSKAHARKKINHQEIKVRSISHFYYLKIPNDYEEIIDGAFLLLADVICTFGNKKLGEKYWIPILKNAFSEMDSNCLVFFYDEYEEAFRKAYDAIEERKILEALKNIFILEKSEQYKEYWIKVLWEKLGNSLSKNDISKAFKYFSLHYDEYALKETEYIVSWFEKNMDISSDDLFIFCNLLTNGTVGDNSFSKMNEMICEENYFKVYELMEKIESSDANNELIEEGLRRLNTSIEKNIDDDSFSRLVKELNENTFKSMVTPNVNYVFEKTYDLLKKNEELSTDKYIEFLLYDSGVALSNHSGNTERCRKFLLKIERTKKYINESEYNKRLNRYIVSYIDLLDFDKAFVISKENVISSGKRRIIKKLSTSDFELKDKENAKALSQFAQICAFMNKSNSDLIEKGVLSEAKFEDYKDFVEGIFEMSLKRFRKDSSDYRITMNYLMHYYLAKLDELTIIKEYESFAACINTPKQNLTKAEMRRNQKALIMINEKRAEYEVALNLQKEIRDKYKKSANILFDGNQTPYEQLKYILLSADKKNKRNPVFELFLWAKALLRIYDIAEIKDTFQDNGLINVIIEKKKNYHPWELIYFHLAEVSYEIGEANYEKIFAEGIDIDSESVLIKCLIHNSYNKYYQHICFDKKAKKEMNELERLLKEYTNGRLPKDDVTNVITYTYL